MKKVDIAVRELVSMVQRGELRLPEMQRRYVWRAPRVRDLLDSLYRGYPSGSILVWETEREQPTRDMAVAQSESPFAGHKLLLDGQQRITSLSAVLRGESVQVRGRKKPIDILFNLDHPDGLGDFTEVDSDAPDDGEDDDDDDDDGTPADVNERFRNLAFVVASKQLAALPNWVRVSQVFGSESDGEFLERAGIVSLKDPRYPRYAARLQRLRAIRNYPYVMHVLEGDLSYEEVAEIFVRVNSLGMKLRGSDLALAQITARWQNSLALLEEFQTECEESWFTLDLGLLVRAMVVFATGQSRFRSVTSIPVPRLQDGWEKAKAGLRYAINFVRSNADIEDESLLSSPLLLLPIAYYSQLRKEAVPAREESELLFWLLVANARGRYGRGSAETLLDADLGTLARGGAPGDLVETVRQQFGRLMFDPEEFVGRGPKSPMLSVVFLALRAAGAKDWRTGLKISLTHWGNLHYIEYHHVFPKALLKGRYEQREINELANMAFTSGNTNRRIGKKKPAECLPKIIQDRGEEALTSQAVPLEAQLHDVDRYREFLEWRRRALAERVNGFLERARQAP